MLFLKIYSDVYRNKTISVPDMYKYKDLALLDYIKFLGIKLIYSGPLIEIFVQLNLMCYF